MDKGIHFKDNTYGLGGLPADAHATALNEYDNWAQWASLPAGNVAERNEGLHLYVKCLAWNSYVSEFGTAEERNDGRAQENLALSFVHMESFRELDDLRRESHDDVNRSLQCAQAAGRPWSWWCCHACGEAGEDDGRYAGARVDR